MDVAAKTTLTHTAATAAMKSSSSVASTAQAMKRFGDSPVPDQANDIRKLAEQLVAQTFFGTLMRQMRSSVWKSDLMSGGRGGEAFQQMHDQQLVERMGRGAGRKLVDSLVRQLTSDVERQRQAREAMKSNQQVPSERPALTA
jgi:Rod binding domain-containing protein